MSTKLKAIAEVAKFEGEASDVTFGLVRGLYRASRERTFAWFEGQSPVAVKPHILSDPVTISKVPVGILSFRKPP
jgi:hypothetical protein